MNKRAENNETLINYFDKNKDNIIERLEAGFIAYVQIQTNMNFPLLLKNDKIALRKNDYYRIKDIVLYRFENYYFLRRIIKIDEEKYYVCGDNEYDVRIISPSMIIARAISRERGNKRLSLILMNKNRLYFKAILKKGKLRMKKHLFSDDSAIVMNLIEKISTQETETKEIIENPMMNLDSRLEAQLSVFKSPEQRLKEYLEENENSSNSISEDT